MLSRILFISILLVTYPLCSSALAEHQIKLKNGNIIKGEIQASVLTFKSDTGVVDVPINGIKSITESVTWKDGNTYRKAVIAMQDGAVIKGKYVAKTLVVKTKSGVLNIKTEDIKEITPILQETPAASPKQALNAPPAAQPETKPSTLEPKALPSLSAGTEGKSAAGKDRLTMKGRIGAGLLLDAANLGAGPVADYWATENIGVTVSTGLLGDFKTYGIRGNYLFNKRLDLRGLSARPYAGVGYISVTGPEESSGPITVKTEGSGLEAYAGLLHPAPYIHKNVYLRPELVYSTVNVEGTGEYTAYGTKYKVSVDANYSAIGLGLSVVYYFR